jgi:PAS domain-containing protein
MDLTETSHPQLWRAFFDALPLPAFIVDEDVHILDFNTEAEKLLGPAPKSSLWRRGGDVLHCVYAEKLGCGHAKPCKNCLIRNSVKDALAGLDTHRKFFQAELRGVRGAYTLNLFVTARRLPDTPAPQALLILENVEDTVRLYRQQSGP